MSAAPPHADLLDGGLLRVVDACLLLAVSRSFLYAAMDRGEIPFCRLGRARRVSKRGLIEYAASRLHGAAEERPR